MSPTAITTTTTQRHNPADCLSKRNLPRPLRQGLCDRCRHKPIVVVVAVEQQHDIVIIHLRIAEAVWAHVRNGHGERAGGAVPRFVNLSASAFPVVMTNTLSSVPRASALLHSCFHQCSSVHRLLALAFMLVAVSRSSLSNFVEVVHTHTNAHTHKRTDTRENSCDGTGHMGQYSAVMGVEAGP